MLAGRITYANVVATLALFVALGGSAVAATTLISGRSIRRGSIPANRLRAHSLTRTQLNLKRLGALPHAKLADHAASADTATSAVNAANAANATSATNATHAGSADSAANATHAANADLLGGLDSSAFVPATRFEAGEADSTSTRPVPILTWSDMSLRIETDGNADFDANNVTVRNLRTTGASLLIAGDASSQAVPPGSTVTVTTAASPMAAESDEVRFVVQDLPDQTRQVLIECEFPTGGKALTLCRGTRFD